MTAATRAFSLPLADPLSTARGTVERRDGLLLCVDGDGPRGLGEATPLPGWTESLADCRTALAEAVECLSGGEFDAALLATADAPAAGHAVDLARADRRARADGVPLYRHLGADARVGSVPVNAVVGDAPADRTAARASEAVDAGFDCVKVKVGVRPVAADVERLRRVREAVGPEVELRADANGAWDREQARRALDAIGDLGVAYVEQPLPPGDLAGHADLRGGPVGVALDETLAETPVADVLDAGAADAVVLKPMVQGGVGRARRAAVAAREAGVEAVVTTTVDGVVARTAAVHLAASLPGRPACGLATAGRLAADLAPDPAPVADGRATVPQEAGLGVEGAWEGAA